MIVAIEPLLPDHPTALAWGQLATAVVALISFYWAYRHARPKPKPQPQRRLNKTEDVVGAVRLCNPGRRATDRCSTCPHDETCIRRLPVLTEAEIARERAAVKVVEETIAYQKAPGSVLFVDDNAELRKMAEILLSVAGMRVRLAGSVHEVVPIRSDEDVLVTDWRLEDGTGADVIRAYREVKKGYPVIVVSALDRAPKELPEDVMYLRKPFNPDDLIHLIQQALES